MSRRVCRLRDILSLKYGKGLRKRERKPGEHPVYGSGGIIDTHESPLIQGPGIIIGRKGSAGTVYFSKTDFFPIDTVFYVMLKNPRKLDLRFVYYLLKSMNLPELNSHAAVPGISRESIESQSCSLPVYAIQKKISEILGQYDDLIAINNRRIQNLVKMARALYRDWFVSYEILRDENTKLANSELEIIPDGWKIVKVHDAFEICGGGTPNTKIDAYWKNGEINWYTPSDLTKSRAMFMDESTKKITRVGLDKSSARLFDAYSVMMTSRATLGVVSINTTIACTNQGFIICIPNEHISKE